VTAGGAAQITDLTMDDHACLTYGEQEELHDLTAAFVRDGLSSGLKVVWLSDSGSARAIKELTRRGIAVEPAMAAGQMAAAESAGRLLSDQAFTADHAIGWLTGEMAACRLEGFPGLRVALDVSWALRPVTGVEQLPEFEESVAAALAGSKVCVLCQYDRERFDPVTLASVAAFHTRSVAAATYHADAVLRICRQYTPPGIRVAGELDYNASQPLALALAEAIRLDGDITVNLTDLSFIDAACIRMILDAARGLAPSRTIVLRGNSSIVTRFACDDAPGIPGVRLITADER
jgi:ABC-type transporter Mla MlaB component